MKKKRVEKCSQLASSLGFSITMGELTVVFAVGFNGIQSHSKITRPLPFSFLEFSQTHSQTTSKIAHFPA
jgi:hypothetical protein